MLVGAEFEDTKNVERKLYDSRQRFKILSISQATKFRFDKVKSVTRFLRLLKLQPGEFCDIGSKSGDGIVT